MRSINKKNEGRSKFNVSKDVCARTYDGIVFASQLEMNYYKDVVLPLSRSGEIVTYALQKAYTLQPEFRNNAGKAIRPIEYVADFYIEYADGRVEVIDTKGYADSAARMKRKMFWYLYPDIPYRWITYVKKYGGWIDFDEVNRLRRKAKREKANAEEKEKNDGQKES